jgi:hypothetical protein
MNPVNLPRKLDEDVTGRLLTQPRGAARCGDFTDYVNRLLTAAIYISADDLPSKQIISQALHETLGNSVLPS